MKTVAIESLNEYQFENLLKHSFNKEMKSKDRKTITSVLKKHGVTKVKLENNTVKPIFDDLNF